MFILAPFFGLGLFIRGPWGHGILAAILSALASQGSGVKAEITTILLLIALGIGYGLVGNKLYARRLLIKGWKMEGDDEAQACARSKWGIQ